MSALSAAVASLVVALALRAALGRLLAPTLPASDGEPTSVTALLPVRDEESNLAPCLAGVLAQNAVARVLVLDDGSRDRTAERAAAVAAADRRVELRAVPEPPPGLSGKIHALARGAREVRTDWLLALDADVRLAPDTLARALAAARSQHLDAVSLAARQRVGSVGEALLTPLVFGLLDFVLGDWRAVARGAGSPVANGQFFLVRRDALAAVGGYEAIAGEPLDDVALARRLAAAGARVGFWRAGRALEVRMYHGLAASFRGWRRNLALIFGDRRSFTAAAIVAALLPGATAAMGLAAGRPGAALLAWSGGVAASALLRAGTGSSPLWALAQPFDGMLFAACLTIASLDRARGRVAPWRGRTLSPPDAAQPGSDSGAA